MGIQKQSEYVKQHPALLVVAMGAPSPNQEAVAKRVIYSNKTTVEEEKRKEVEGKKIKEVKKEAEERKKKEEEVLKEVAKLAAQAQAVKDSQKKVARHMQQKLSY